jgi:dTDP-4-amino-4,6-dideoxygalactose transaminase
MGQPAVKRTNAKVKIPFVDLCTDEKEHLLQDIFEDMRRVFNSSQYILGDEVANFEKKFARVAGCAHAIGVNSGLDALVLGLRALGIQPGDEVITVPNSYVASAAAIALVGAKIVFVDAGSDYNIDPSLVEAAVTPKTKAIIPVHLTGNPCRMDLILELARKHHLKVIEDAAQSVGATFEGKPVGGMGDLGCFSLHPLKNLHVWGDGGMISTNDKDLDTELRLQRNHGHKTRDEVEFFSYNSRLDSIQAVVATNYLRLLEDTTASRIRHASLYNERLASLEDYVIRPIVDTERVRHVFHIYQICAKDRDKLRDFLLGQGIETKIHYPIPIYLQKAAQSLGYKKGDFPVTDRLVASILSLPVRENLTDDEIHQVCDAIELFYKG